MVASSERDYPLLLASATSPKRTSRQPSGIRVLLAIIALLLPFLFIGVELVNRKCSDLRGSEQPAAFQEGIETSSPPGAKEGCQGHLAVGALP